MLLVSPLDHLKGTHNVERHTRQGKPSEDIEPKPRHDFAEIVGRVNKLKEEPSGEHNGIPTLLAKLREHDVADKVEDHEDNKPGSAKVNTPDRRLHPVGGSVDVPADKEGCSVVVGAVLEKVEDRHSEGPKLVDKDGLELSLEVVNVPKDEGKLLGKVKLHLGVLVVEKRGETKSKDGVYHDGAEVLNKIDGPEGDLGAKVLENDLAAILKTVLGKGLVTIGVKNDNVGLGPNGKPLTRNGYLGLLVDGLLEVDDLGVTVNLNCGEGLEVTLENFNLHLCEGVCVRG